MRFYGGTMRRRKLIHPMALFVFASLAALSAQPIRVGRNGPWASLFTLVAPPASAATLLETTSSSYDALGMLRHWNTIAVDASGLDHTPLRAGEVRTVREQFGPGKAAHAIAIVHIAIYDAV